MSRVTFSRKRVKLKKHLGIRTRLALLALLLVAPLMVERVRSLEDTRAKQVAQTSLEYSNLVRHSSETQREIVSSVETILKSTAYIRASGGIAGSCDIMRASLPNNLPWIRAVMIVGGDGRIQCSTNNMYVGTDLSDRPYLKQARETQNFVFSDFLLARPTNTPMIMAAYPVSALNTDSDAIVIASIGLDWMSKLMTNLSERPGIMSVLVNSSGTVLAAPSDQASLVGKPIDAVPLLAAVAERALYSSAPVGSITLTGADGARRLVNFAVVPGTQSRVIVSIDEAKVTSAINREIRSAYWQLAFRLPVRAARRLDRRGKTHHRADRDDDRHGQALWRGRHRRPRQAQPPSFRIRAAGARLQCDGRPALRPRARAGRHQRPAYRDRLARHAVGARQPARLPEPARLRMDEGAAI